MVHPKNLNIISNLFSNYQDILDHLLDNNNVSISEYLIYKSACNILMNEITSVDNIQDEDKLKESICNVDFVVNEIISKLDNIKEKEIFELFIYTAYAILSENCTDAD